MKKMITEQISIKNKLHVGHYSNGQLAVFVHAISGEPIAELSIEFDLVELSPNEFILKDYSENIDIAKEYVNAEILSSTNRFVLVGSHLCPVCQIVS